MYINKAWDWKNENNPRWLIPSEDSFYFLHRWKDLDFKRILDLGCGRGRHSLLFARNGFHVTALDLSDYSVNELKEKSINQNLDITCIVSDMTTLPLEDDSIDGVFAYHVISHSNSTGVRQVLSEIKRVVVNHGEVFITFGSEKTLEMINKDSVEFIEKNVIIKKVGAEKGIPHFYISEPLLHEYMSEFNVISVRKIQNIDLNNNLKYGYHYFVHAKVLK